MHSRPAGTHRYFGATISEKRWNREVYFILKPVVIRRGHGGNRREGLGSVDGSILEEIINKYILRTYTLLRDQHTGSGTRAIITSRRMDEARKPIERRFHQRKLTLTWVWGLSGKIRPTGRLSSVTYTSHCTQTCYRLLFLLSLPLTEIGCAHYVSEYISSVSSFNEG